MSGAELDQVSAREYCLYEDSGVNWRVVEGYGTAIAGHAAGVPVAFNTPVQRIDHSARRLRIETPAGTIATDAAIVTIPSNVLAEEGLRFTPALPEKVEAASGLPLGLADKLFLYCPMPTSSTRTAACSADRTAAGRRPIICDRSAVP